MKVETSAVVVTPKQAKFWLDNFNTQNRVLRHERVKQFSKDMKSNRWEFTHQGIAFYEDGTLADGQHRLAAVVDADMPMTFLVTTGLARNVAAKIDQNRPREAHDAIRIAGEETWINRDIVAIIRTLLSNFGENPKSFSLGEIVDYAVKHKDLFITVESLTRTKKRNFTQSGIAACYFAAMYAGVPAEKIKRFIYIMLYGEISDSSENAAIRLREFLLSTSGAWIGKDKFNTAKRAQRAIQAFSDGQPLAKLFMPDAMIYPVPE